MYKKKEKEKKKPRLFIDRKREKKRKKRRIIQSFVPLFFSLQSPCLPLPPSNSTHNDTNPYFSSFLQL
jgi:hypothetical protein